MDKRPDDILLFLTDKPYAVESPARFLSRDAVQDTGCVPCRHLFRPYLFFPCNLSRERNRGLNIRTGFKLTLVHPDDFLKAAKI